MHHAQNFIQTPFNNCLHIDSVARATDASKVVLPVDPTPQPSLARTPPVCLRPELVLKQANFTKGGYNAFDNLVYAFRLARELPLVCTLEELCDENARDYFMTFCAWVSNQVIPYNFKVVLDKNGHFDGLAPSSATSMRGAVPSTLVGYIGKHLTEIRNTFPKHPDWANNQNPSWWTDMRANFIKVASNFQQKHVGDGTIFGGTDILPMYWNLPSEASDQPWSGCDLKHVNTALVKGAGTSNAKITNLSIVTLCALSSA